MSQYENHNLEDQILPFIYRPGSVRATDYRFGSSNWHENIELLYITDGEGLVSDNSQLISVSKGDVAVINSNHLHALAGGHQPMSYRYLIVDRAFCIANGFDSAHLSFRTKIADRELNRLLDELHAAYGMSKETQYRTLTIRALVLQLMLLLCKNHSTAISQEAHADRGAAYIKQAIDYIRATYDKDVSLEDVASFIGISACYLSREFHKYTGYSFVAYLNRTRCKKAQQLLSDDRLDIHEIGKQCGFENRSYFSKIFRRYIGASPIEYRTKVLKHLNQME